MAQEILLDSGTNEVEILEFFLGEQSFGINVAKVTQIVALDDLEFTSVPDRSDSYLGVLLWHGQTIPFIDLSVALRRRKIERSERPIVLVTRFNDVTNGFLISGVNYIHRVGWDQIDPPSSIIEKNSSTITGSVHIDDRDILLIDFEYIVADIFPETKMSHKMGESNLTENLAREDVRLVFAEDSTFVRRNVTALLAKVGYRNVKTFENGQDAYEYLSDLKKKTDASGNELTDLVNLVVTDIEMPRMDGLTLCKKLKKELGFDTVPVALFSSLIDDQMGQKCKEVGADVYISKPKINELVSLIDGLLHINPA